MEQIKTLVPIRDTSVGTTTNVHPLAIHGEALHPFADCMWDTLIPGYLYRWTHHAIKGQYGQYGNSCRVVFCNNNSMLSGDAIAPRSVGWYRNHSRSFALSVYGELSALPFYPARSAYIVSYKVFGIPYLSRLVAKSFCARLCVLCVSLFDVFLVRGTTQDGILGTVFVDEESLPYEDRSDFFVSLLSLLDVLDGISHATQPDILSISLVCGIASHTRGYTPSSRCVGARSIRLCEQHKIAFGARLIPLCGHHSTVFCTCCTIFAYHLFLFCCEQKVWWKENCDTWSIASKHEGSHPWSNCLFISALFLCCQSGKATARSHPMISQTLGNIIYHSILSHRQKAEA